MTRIVGTVLGGSRTQANVSGPMRVQRTLTGLNAVRATAGGVGDVLRTIVGDGHVDVPPIVEVDPPSGLEVLLEARRPGRFKMPNVYAGYVLGQDNASTGESQLETSTITTADKQEIAAAGFAFMDAGRAFGNTGQAIIDEIRSYNPDFQFITYLHYGHRYAVADPVLSNRLGTWRWNNLSAAKCIDGSDSVAWYEGGNPANPVAYHWVDYWTGRSGGDLYNRDLVEGEVESFKQWYDHFEHKPCGVMLDYMNNRSSGYYVWPGNPELDILQDGLAYPSNEAAKDAFLAAQLAFIDHMRSLFSDDFVIVANGRGALPVLGQPEVRQRLDGFFVEHFPTTVWGSTQPSDVFDHLWEGLIAKNQGYRIPFPASRDRAIFLTDLRDIWSMTSTYADIGRMAAIMFDGLWKYLPINYLGEIQTSEIDDAEWDSDISAFGVPNGPLMRGEAMNLVSYERAGSTGATCQVVLDRNLTGISQVLYAQIRAAAKPNPYPIPVEEFVE